MTITACRFPPCGSRKRTIDGIDISSSACELSDYSSGTQIPFPSMSARASITNRQCYLFSSGGKCSNIFFAPLSRFLVFLSGLLESVSLDEPRQIKFLALASNRSTTRVPTW
jgi:hypothetical protein